MPDGEIMTAPVEDSLNGEIFFDFPGVLSGRLIHDIRLRWKAGRLLEASSATNQDFLRAVLATDAGSGIVGEFAMGTNLAVDRFCKDILIDEKIGGTVHLAFGRSYPECGGLNSSAIHWDIVKDIRAEGLVEVDGTPVLRNGEFLF
jgi:aminopeptidase